MSGRGGAQLFHLRSKHYAHTGVMITTNQQFAVWDSVSGHAKMATTMLDRPTHHCHIVETGDESRRFKTSTARVSRRQTTRCRIHPTPRVAILYE
ncbi:ATP-binding protein [Methyloversatilis sp. XJ19-49]|uniref:ATP-binding protein n=1 Tax=Methyloversatilis sp. XJ19-49 TaxID=2963429 RepID=UPI00359C600D